MPSSVVSRCLIGLALVAGAATPAAAQVSIAFTPVVANCPAAARCTATVTPNPTSDDPVELRCSGLPANKAFTWFATQSATGGALPVSFVGQFQSSSTGTASARMEFEVFNNFLAVPADAREPNPNQNCVANVAGEGALANNPQIIPLKFFRIYLGVAGATPTVFGRGPNSPGGLVCLVSGQIPNGAF